MMRLRFRPEVVDDLESAAKWYDKRQPGLGAEFLQECSAALERLVKRPEQGAIDPDGVRSVRIHRFAYLIHFRPEGDVLVVFAVMHGGRDPAAWRGRTT